MQIFSYRTIQQPSEGSYKEKGSKFLGFAYPVQAEQDVKQKIAELKKEYFDARHHCYAYIIGADKMKYRAFDDGEPNHSAGDPILGQIRSKNLTNVLVVVVRYFGGVKLGVGGLISAYKMAAENALNNSTVIEKDVLKKYFISYAYTSTPDVMTLIKEYKLEIMNQSFADECKLDVNVPLQFNNEFKEKVLLLQATGVTISIQEIIPLS